MSTWMYAAAADEDRQAMAALARNDYQAFRRHHARARELRSAARLAARLSPPQLPREERPTVRP